MSPLDLVWAKKRVQSISGSFGAKTVTTIKFPFGVLCYSCAALASTFILQPWPMLVPQKANMEGKKKYLNLSTYRQFRFIYFPDLHVWAVGVKYEEIISAQPGKQTVENIAVKYHDYDIGLAPFNQMINSTVRHLVNYTNVICFFLFFLLLTQSHSPIFTYGPFTVEPMRSSLSR